MVFVCSAVGLSALYSLRFSLSFFKDLMDLSEFSFVYSPLIVVLFLLFTVAPVQGQSKVIGSPQPIKASPGIDVILPCHVEPPVDVVRLTVEWSKLDLEPNHNDHYVHLYRDRREILDMKLPSFLQRTELFTNDLRQGNISLKITNITLEDEGRYRCFIPKLRSRIRSSVVQLVVEPLTAPTEMPPQLTTVYTPDFHGETNIIGCLSRRRLIPAGVFIIFLMVIGTLVTRSVICGKASKTRGRSCLEPC
ncbi:CD276 antigen-like [Cheilinus undulatus]|uniref:CD276 antigen-like n=1 Tax=Cheilinus undulatus TaxID=241271 RepID=UPI001BD4A08F|nr:CD276 antigen-like [Cheilinus undulatus]